MVQVVVPNLLAGQAQGRRRFDVDAETVRDALRALPVADLLFDERGELLPHLNVFVDAVHLSTRGGLDARVAGVREIRVLPNISGAGSATSCWSPAASGASTASRAR